MLLPVKRKKLALPAGKKIKLFVNFLEHEKY